jgi:hypothetical protein
MDCVPNVVMSVVLGIIYPPEGRVSDYVKRCCCVSSLIVRLHIAEAGLDWLG